MVHAGLNYHRTIGRPCRQSGGAEADGETRPEIEKDPRRCGRGPLPSKGTGKNGKRTGRQANQRRLFCKSDGHHQEGTCAKKSHGKAKKTRPSHQVDIKAKGIKDSRAQDGPRGVVVSKEAFGKSSSRREKTKQQSLQHSGSRMNAPRMRKAFSDQEGAGLRLGFRKPASSAVEEMRMAA